MQLSVTALFCLSILVLSGQLADATSFQRSCPDGSTPQFCFPPGGDCNPCPVQRPDICPDGSTPVVCFRAPCPPCPGGGPKICSLPADVGHCDAAIPRYFFNSKTGKCEFFSYGGCGGNSNRFKTLKECQAQCPGGGTINVCKLPKKVGPCKAAIPKWFFNSATGQCEQFTWGGCSPNGNNFDTFSECNRQCPGVVPINVCKLPKKVGPCEAAINRWFFNSATGQCEKFIWGGCQPNGNNFETFADCNKQCPGVVPVNVCKLPKKVDPCRAAINRWFFNSQTGLCELFSWGGCQPNGNNFETQAACQRSCPEVVPVNVCKLPKKVGPCRAAIPRWFFNSQTQQCEQFSWGGCQPNGNNFESQSACQRRCPGFTLPFCLPRKSPCGPNTSGKCCQGLECCPQRSLFRFFGFDRTCQHGCPVFG